jgi:hypothetical protein
VFLCHSTEDMHVTSDMVTDCYKLHEVLFVNYRIRNMAT